MHNRINPTAPFHPRNGAPKSLATPPPVVGHRSRIARSHTFKHGAPVNDGSNPPLSRESPIAVYPGMTAQQKAKHEAISDSAGVFSDAAKLGR
jgi:hypothetical protein